ncbi:hypothetical protein Leryth_007375 [Lithospermum erythrorhizon]|nr:hypothetical protein Leryth_007375 [Lithospermum erythrorhizon]
MEEDDDFGELYSDILLPSPPPPPPQIRRDIDLNAIDNGPDDDEVDYAAPDSGSKAINAISFDHGSTELDSGVRVLEKGFDGGLSVSDEDIHVVVEESHHKDGDFIHKDDNLGGETGNFEGFGGVGGSTMIPGVSGMSGFSSGEHRDNLGGGSGNLEEFGGSTMIPGVSSMSGFSSGLQGKDNLGGESGNREGLEGSTMIPGVSMSGGLSSGLQGAGHRDLNFDEESDSDSDDLQIVLNNDNEMGMERMGGDDEDGDGLVILAADDTLGNSGMMENSEWGDEAGLGADGERKELGDATKVNGGVAVHPKVPYGNHGFHHPFHSQFKYVRPGAAPLAGPVPPGPVGPVGQVRPPVVGPIPGRGRGDWRPSLIKGGPVLQKAFHPGFGAPAWGSNSAGRGLDFTLPSHKTIFEVDIDSFEDKPWRLPGIDMSDFFNFGLNEEGWKEYCKQLEQHRLETTMQSRIRTYESGRAEQDYDPDLPPELAAASGALDISSENITIVTTDPGQDASNRARPPPPTGRPIQVETNYTDRLPSVDSRQHRIRDSDAIIEINCHGSADESSPEIDTVEPEEDQISDVLARGEEIEDISDENNKKERRIGHTVPLSSKSPTHSLLGSREATPQFSGENHPIAEEERRMKARTSNRSPRKATSETTREKQSADDQNEKSYESIDGKHSRLSLSPDSVGAAIVQDVEHQISIPNEPVRENSLDTEREGLDLDITSQDDMLRDEDLLHSSEKQKSSSKVEVSQGTDEIDDSRAASSDDNNSRSRNSKGSGKSREAVDETSQAEGSAHMGKMKRSIDRDDNMIQRKGYNERKDAGRRHTSAKGEESYAHKGWEHSYSNRLHPKADGPDRQRESDNSERALPKSDEGLRGRRTRVEDAGKRDHVDEIGSKHRNKVRESERSMTDEHNQLREHLDIRSRSGNPDKVTASKRNRDDGLKKREESIDSLHNKRRKEDGTHRRELTEKEIIFYGNRDSSGRRKRERDDVSDEWKRDQPRIRDDDVYSVRYKEEGLFQRERGERQRDRDEWHRVKHPSEDMLSKREREDVMSRMNNIRSAEEKVWSSHSRVKDEYRGSAREYYQKDVTQHSQQPKRSDRTESESLVQHRGREDIHMHGNQHRSDGRRPRQERGSTRDDRIANASDSHRVHEEKPKEYPRKGKEREGGYPNSVPHSGKNQNKRSGLKSDLANSKGEHEHGSSENLVHGNHHSSSAKLNEEVPSDDEHHHSRRGRSKLERWESHKERDFSSNTKSSSSLQIKEPEAQISSGLSLGTKVPNEHPKPVEDKQLASIKDKGSLETNNSDGKSVDNKHLDTVEKLKKRSERFKLPMPGEKEITATKKVENEPPPPPSQPEIHPDIEIKPERPARKRRWTNN